VPRLMRMPVGHDAAESIALKRAIDGLHEQQVYLKPRLAFDDLFQRECIRQLQQGLQRRRCKENTGFNFGTIVSGTSASWLSVNELMRLLCTCASYITLCQ
jgi:hypothetical protein